MDETTDKIEHLNSVTSMATNSLN